ncbi:MAG: glycoside hydrolase family protein, partial [Prevotella sp.]|nr:glycoside hydrolase family protein [Prevotella sp.]
MKKALMTIAALLALVAADAQTLATGGQFMDLLLPMEGSVAATASDWGTTAGENTDPNHAGTWEGTLGRWKDNGIEDTERSYWGANIVKDGDGKYHMYVAGWPSATCGHRDWSSNSMVYHVTSDNVWGPYTYVSTLGTGHNPEIYKTGDTYVIYKIEPLGYYKSTTLGDTWETGEYTFDLRDRTLIAGENRETSLSNCSFAKREDGSFVMIDRGGGIWVSRDGLTDAWHQLTDASVYLNTEITNRGSLEDPVIWRDHLQYHMIVNDWRARYAYYYRSLDGLHWTKEAGKAYTGQDPFAKHTDGTVEKWHKYERPRVYQDEQGRAIRMNFAVIDCVKESDVAGDDHSSKNINMPLTKQLLLEVQSVSSTSATVLVKAETGFDPKTDLDFSTLKFGSHDKVNYGNGFSYSSHAASGDDVVITFTGADGSINAGEWAPKMLGQKTDGAIAFGYAKMPGVDYKPAMLSAITPAIAADGTVQSVSITNYGQSAATATTVRVYNPAGSTLLAHGTTSALAAYGTETVTLTKDAAAASGYTAIQVRFYNGETLVQTENIPLTTINAAQQALQAIIDEATTLYNDASLTNGKTELNTAIGNATAVVACYNVATLEEQTTALKSALNTFKYANASPANGLSITIENATMDDLSAWTLMRLDADNAPGWKTNGKGASYDGFDGNFVEYWVNQNGTLSYANRASQTLSDMPAGRYRLRANVIATRQNSNDAVTGVTLFANNQTTTCATAKDGTPQEYMVEITLAEAGSMEIGIDVQASTTANWVAWDNVTLKYFG